MDRYVIFYYCGFMGLLIFVCILIFVDLVKFIVKEMVNLWEMVLLV